MSWKRYPTKRYKLLTISTEGRLYDCYIMQRKSEYFVCVCVHNLREMPLSALLVSEEGLPHYFAGCRLLRSRIAASLRRDSNTHSEVGKAHISKNSVALFVVCLSRL